MSALSKYPHRISRCLASLVPMLLLQMSAAAQALQLIETQDGMTVDVRISSKEPTRIRIEGAPITDVFGNVSSSCGDAAAAPSPGLPPAPSSPSPTQSSGELILECDRDKGEIYVRPLDGRLGENRKALALFVASAHATYTLMLRRADMPADTIVIRDRQVQSQQQVATSARPSGKGRSAPIRAMKALLLAMASPLAATDFRVAEVNRQVAWWKEADLVLLRRFEGRDLLGEQYLLRNTSANTLVLTEQEFDRDSARVLGVAIEHHQLTPAQSTTVYVIRRGNAP